MFFDVKAKLFLKSKMNKTSSHKRVIMRVKMGVTENGRMVWIAMRVEMGISENGRMVDLIWCMMMCSEMSDIYNIRKMLWCRNGTHGIRVGANLMCVLPLWNYFNSFSWIHKESFITTRLHIFCSMFTIPPSLKLIAKFVYPSSPSHFLTLLLNKIFGSLKYVWWNLCH